ncbi:TonB-dependent receptor [Phaeovulum sp.]|uniref:TonB-dependent receptor n=1 Tax=Phaeovulum sp. TaxID=2934796 RepID=UPI0039E36DD7
MTCPTPRHPKISLALLLGSALPLATPALAQDSDIFVLDAISVIGTGLPTEVLKNPATITVIDGEALKKTAPVSVAALLRDVPGVHIAEQGIERISIRGENSRRVAILINGQKLADHTDYGPPVLVDPTTIERIEVVRGSSSVVSGSGAIGGVINIVTKKGASTPFSLSTTAGYMSATDGYRLSATGAGTINMGEGALDYRLSLGKMDQGDRKTPDGTLDNSDVQDESLSAYLGYRQGDHYFGVRTQAYDIASNVYTGDPSFTLSLPRRELRKFSAFYEGTNLTPWLNHLTVDAFRQTIDRELVTNLIQGPIGVRSRAVDDQATWGANLRAEMSFSDTSRTMAGLSYTDDQLIANKTTSISRPPLPLPITTVTRDDATLKTFSAFAQHEIELGNNLTATFGGRWYDVQASLDASTKNGVNNPLFSNSDSMGLVSAGLVWSPDETLALRANLSQGYIYPTLGQMFLTATGGDRTIIGNPDLAPEKSTTFELGGRFDQGGTVIDATLFYTDAKDYIAVVNTSAPGATPRTATYENVDKARSYGVELLAEQHMDAWGITPYASVALMRRELTYANSFSTTDSGTPAFSGSVGVRKDWALANVTGTFDLFLRGESSVDFRAEDGVVTDSAAGYGTLNLRSDMVFNNGITLTAELNNITDRSYQAYDQAPGTERSLSLFVTKTF